MSDTPNNPETPGWNAEPIFRWLVQEGRFCGDLDELVTGLGRRLVAAGAPIWRLRVSMRTLHPLITAVSSVWEVDRPTVQRIESTHGLEERGAHVGSPLEIVSRTRAPYRKRLSDGLSDSDHNVLHDLKARGATDYYGLPLPMADGHSPVFVVVTDIPEGFSDQDIAGFADIAVFLAPVVEVFRLRLLSAAVAEAYLGERTGRRVLKGQIIRGDVGKIDAAIMMADIRDWTGLNERVAPETAVELANQCFDVLAEAIDTHDGEILKFVGDGLLAIFPSAGDNGSAAAVCEAALAAARAALGADRPNDRPADVRFGIGLNFGEVLYGNIGSSTRLDFTVMGQAVNVAARIEELCDATHRPLLFSQQVADRLREPATFVTEARLKGQEGLSKVFTAAEYA